MKRRSAEIWDAAAEEFEREMNGAAAFGRRVAAAQKFIVQAQQIAAEYMLHGGGDLPEIGQNEPEPQRDPINWNEELPKFFDQMKSNGHLPQPDYAQPGPVSSRLNGTDTDYGY